MNAKRKSNGAIAAEVANAAWSQVAARVMQLIGIPALMVISGWMFMTLNDVSAKVVRIEETIKQRIAWSDDRFAKTTSDFNVANQRINDMELRVRALEIERARK